MRIFLMKYQIVYKFYNKIVELLHDLEGESFVMFSSYNVILVCNGWYVA